MTNTYQEADDLLYDLLIENHITIKDVYNCMEQHEDEIMNMMKIFNLLDDRDRLLSLTILYLLAREQGKEVTNLYCRDYAIKNVNYRESCTKEDIKLLLTACLDNPIFFSFAMRLYKDIKAKLEWEAEAKKEAEDEQDVEVEAEDEAVMERFAAVIIIFYQGARAAATEDLDTFLEEHMEFNGVWGTLVLKKDNDNWVQYEFVFDEDNYQEKMPFVLEVQFTTKSGSKKPPIILNRCREENVITHIYSDLISGIDYLSEEGNFTIIAKELDTK